MNSHLVTLLSQDLYNAIGALLNELKPRLVPHLPARVPFVPENMVVMGDRRLHGVNVISAPIWKGNTRVVVEDALISIQTREGNGWLEVWRSDAPDMVPVRRQEQAGAQDGQQ
jgi:hypothetical protein